MGIWRKMDIGSVLSLIHISSLNNSLEEKQKTLDELEEPKEAASSAMAALKSGIKYAVLGGVLGGFMAVSYTHLLESNKHIIALLAD